MENLTSTEKFLRKSLGVLLILVSIPPLINIITIPLIAFCVAFGIYLIVGKNIIRYLI